MAGGFLSRISSQTITNTRWYLAGSNAETGNDRSIAESFRVHQKFFSNLGSKAEFADVSGGLAEIGDEFLADLLNKELVHFGVITQICHGSFIRKNDGSFISLYNVYDFVRDNKTLEQAVTDLELQNEQEFLDNFYTEHIEDVAENTGIFVNATSFWISSNLYRHVYQNCFFDNTIIYFGSCFGMLDQSLVDFFLDHGVRMIMGYETPCHADAESVRFVNAFNQLFGTNTHAGESGGRIGDLMFFLIGEISWDMLSATTVKGFAGLEKWPGEMEIQKIPIMWQIPQSFLPGTQNPPSGWELS